MAVYPSRTFGDPVLRLPCVEVTEFDATLRKLADDMLETMYLAPGRGLAAPQVGVLSRVFVMDVAWKEGTPDPLVLVNPVVVAASDERVAREEGCLSIPGRTVRVSRPARVTLYWRDLDGHPHEGAFEGFGATCVQHEIDHLDGVLCLDREEPEPAPVTA